MLPGARFVLMALAAAAAARADGGVTIAPGRTTTLIATEDVGAPLELAFPSPAYARAAAADADGRWDEARGLYREAAAGWTALDRTSPSRPLELAVAKAEREALASQALAFRARAGAIGRGMTPEARRAFRRRQALDEGRLLRDKMMAARAVLGRTPALLYGRALARLREARDQQRQDQPGPGGAEIALLLCATEAVGGDTEAAGFDRARALGADLEDPVDTLAQAACAAALGNREGALAALERFVLVSPVPRPDTLLREVYLANDWDPLRGDPRFERLFR